MKLVEQIRADLTGAMKAKDMRLLGVLRLLSSALSYKQIELGEQVDDETAMVVLKREAKKRRESIDIYKKVGEEKRAADEGYELSVIEKYLPKEMDEESVRKEVERISRESGKIGGVLIGEVMKQLKGKTDGALVARIVNSL